MQPHTARCTYKFWQLYRLLNDDLQAQKMLERSRLIVNALIPGRNCTAGDDVTEEELNELVPYCDK
jgi:hypothetical protein